MTEDKILEIQKETGCDSTLASMMLKFTGGDLDGALQILKSVEKDVLVVKGKFIAQTSKLYGAFMFLYNYKLKSFDNVEIVAKYEDKSGIEFDFNKNWREYYNDLGVYKRKENIDLDTRDRFLSAIVSQRVQFFFDSKLSVKKNDQFDEDMKKFMTDFFTSLLGDINVAVKLKIEKTDIFEIKKSDRGFLFDSDEAKPDTKEESGEHENAEILYLKIEPEISPINGRPVSELSRGDMIAVRIEDDRPIASYIKELLNGVDPKTGETKPVYAELKDLELTENGVFLNVEFGPGIYGQSYFGEDVNIKTLSESDAVVEAPVKKNGVINKYFWLFGGVLIIFVVILVIIMLYN